MRSAPERRALPRGIRRVVHQHRVGRYRFRRVSELVFVRGMPFAVLEWVDLAGDRTPLYLPLDPAKLRSRGKPRNLFYYDDTTSDPRFEDVATAGD